MKKVTVCFLIACVLTGCMSAKDRIALQEAQNEARKIEMQAEAVQREQVRWNRLTPEQQRTEKEQQHAERLKQLKTEEEHARGLGNLLGIGVCLVGGC